MAAPAAAVSKEKVAVWKIGVATARVGFASSPAWMARVVKPGRPSSVMVVHPLPVAPVGDSSATATPDAYGTLAPGSNSPGRRAMFIAMNNFKVASGRGPDFEQRWRDRESYLAGVPGF